MRVGIFQHFMAKKRIVDELFDFQADFVRTSSQEGNNKNDSNNQ